MKGRLTILAVSTLIIAATAFCACAPAEEYLPVTTEELIGNLSAYDGQNVEVTGEFIDDVDQFGDLICPMVEIPPCENGTVEKNLDKYYPFYYSQWGISSSGDNREKHVVAFMPGGSSEWEDFPDFEEGQQIEIRGKALVTEIILPSCVPTCYVEIRSTLYIKVLPENLKIIPSQ
jgi:hypothetical protein